MAKIPGAKQSHCTIPQSQTKDDRAPARTRHDRSGARVRLNVAVTDRLALLWLLYEHVVRLTKYLSRFLRPTFSPQRRRNRPTKNNPLTVFTRNDAPMKLRISQHETSFQTEKPPVTLGGYLRLKDWLDTQTGVFFDNPVLVVRTWKDGDSVMSRRACFTEITRLCERSKGVFLEGLLRHAVRQPNDPAGG